MERKIEVGRKATKYYRRREVPGQECAVVNVPNSFRLIPQSNGTTKIVFKARGNTYYESAAKLLPKKKGRRR